MNTIIANIIIMITMITMIIAIKITIMIIMMINIMITMITIIILMMIRYDNSPTLNWWQKGSQCDSVVGAQDSATLPPGVDK